MPRDTAGNYNLPAGNPVASGEIISASWANSTMNDLGQSLSASLDRYGRGGMLAPFQFTDGTESAPGATWSNEPTTGLYRAAYGDLRFTLTGTDVQRWTNANSYLWRNSQWEEILTQTGGGGDTTINNLVVTGSFTSPGIDDNATSTAITIDSSQKVGIGIITPERALDVGTEDYVIAAFRQTSLEQFGGQKLEIGTTLGVTGVGLSSYGNSIVNSDMFFNVGNDEVMRITANNNDTSGSLLIGRTAYAPASPNSDYGINLNGNGTISQFCSLGGSAYLHSWYNYNTGSPSLVATINGNGDATFSGNFTSKGIDDNATSTAITIDANENVGIGETNPSTKLDVSHNAGNGNAGQLVKITNTNTSSGTAKTLTIGTDNYFASNPGMTVVAENGLSFGVGDGSDLAAQRDVVIDSTGKLGIGAYPAEKLTVNDGDVLIQSAYDASGVTSSNIYFQNRGGGNWRNSYIGTASNSLHFATGGVGSDHTNAAIRMVVDATGNVGIGTLTPFGNARLQVKTGTDRNLAIQTGTTETTGVKVNAFDDAASVNVPLELNGSVTLLKTGEVEAARIDASRNLLVGISTGINNAKLVVQKSGGPAALLKSVGASDEANEPLQIIKTSATNTTAQVFVSFAINNGSNGSGQINANGASQAAFGSFSDERLKENIVELSPQLDNIMALRPAEFDYIESEGGGHQIGFIAQEMEAVYPDAVGERTDGMKTITGWDKTTSRLVKAMQEQQAMIETLQAEVAALKGA